MAGIYIHIPFCRQKCTYCDFYTIVAPSLIDNFVESLLTEIELRRNYLSNQGISTIYFGGGTPSILSHSQFNRIFTALFELFNIDNQAEITLEANPDDLNENYLKMLKSLPFNRISIGIQSFNDNELKNINRRHTAKQAIDSVQNLMKSGLDNISIDLIYGLPGQTIEKWCYNIEKCLELDVKHISVYGLTFEPETPLFKQKNKGIVKETDDEVMIEMHKLMMHKMKTSGYVNYEISNYSKPGFESKHNSAYWKLIPYLGLGPSAHSFDGNSRQWNISSVKKYCDNISNNELFFEKENLSIQAMYNDFVMVKLRTSEGISLNEIEFRFGIDFLKYFNENSSFYLENKLLINQDSYIKLSEDGIFLSDNIMMNLMKTD